MKFVIRIYRETYLVPPDQQFRVRVLEESSDICPNKRKPCHIHGQEHGQGHLEVAPLSGIVPCPHSTYGRGRGEEEEEEEEEEEHRHCVSMTTQQVMFTCRRLAHFGNHFPPIMAHFDMLTSQNWQKQHSCD